MFFILTCFLTCVVAVSLALGRFPLGVPGQEAFFYRQGLQDVLRFSFVFLGLLNGVLLVFLGRENGRLPKWILVPAIAVLTVTLNMWLYRPLYFSWSSRLISTASSGVSCFFTRARTIEAVSSYPHQHFEFAAGGYAAAPTWGKRLTTYPPGLPLVYCLIHRVSSLPILQKKLIHIGKWENCEEFDIRQVVSPASLLPPAVLVNLIYLITLGIIPVLVYMLSREISEPETATWAAISSSLIPATQLFTTAEAILLVPVDLVIVWLGVAGLRRSSPWLMLSCGFMCGVAVFMSFTLLPVLLCVFLLICVRTADRYRVFLTLVSSWILGGLSVYLAGLVFSYDAVRMFWVAASNNAEFYEISGRRYFPSIPFNIAEFSVFCGIPWILMFSLSCYTSLRRWAETRSGKGGFRGAASLPLGTVFPPVVGLVIILMLLSGGTRGEVGRNWLCLMPIVIAASIAGRNTTPKEHIILGCLGVFSLLICSVFIEISFGYWDG